MSSNLPTVLEPEVTHPTPQSAGMVTVTAGREAQMVQMSMLAAKRFPRDEMAALGRIKRACGRPRLAEQSEYSYKRGDSIISGPSVRLAEAIAQNWGNVDVSWFEVERRQGESVVLTQAIDLETNSRKSIVFNVRHWRDTKGGGYAITDERDIYELLANQAQRRVRACILAVIPGDVVEEAIEECAKTLARADGGKPIADRIRDMAVAFQNTFGISREMIEERLQHRLEATTDPELRTLRKVYAAIRDGISTVKEAFPVSPTGEESATPKKTATPRKRNTEPVATAPVQTITQELRARLEKDGIRDKEPEFIRIIHELFLQANQSFSSLEEIEATEPAAITACLRGYSALVRSLQPTTPPPTPPEPEPLPQ
jgi:hypothetical protein